MADRGGERLLGRGDYSTRDANSRIYDNYLNDDFTCVLLRHILNHRTHTLIAILTRLNFSFLEQLDLSYTDFSRLTHVTSMLNKVGWNTLGQSRLLCQLTMFYSCLCLMDIPLPSEVFPHDRVSRLPNAKRYRHVLCNCNVYKVLYHCRVTIIITKVPKLSSCVGCGLFTNRTKEVNNN